MLLEHAVSNPCNVTGEQIQRDMEKFNREIGRFNPATRHLHVLELPEYEVCQYIFGMHRVKFDRDLRELEMIFWDAAAPGEPCRGIADFLEYLHEANIRTGVVSNISFCGESLRSRVESCIPTSHFDFFIASSEYVFRKPSRHIFEIALAESGLKAEDVWFCGDQFKCDIEGASAVGMTPVWYKEYLKYDGECVMTDGIEIQSWSELVEIIEKIQESVALPTEMG
jgi:putative hydrolase of the HAD superfamily